MALTESTMLALGTKAPDFNLPDTVSGKMVSLHDIKSDIATVIIFSCNHCPYVIHVNPEIVRLAKEYQDAGVSFAAISCNDVDRVSSVLLVSACLVLYIIATSERPLSAEIYNIFRSHPSLVSTVDALFVPETLHGSQAGGIFPLCPVKEAVKNMLRLLV